MKFMKVLCVVAIALCLAGSVYAETQSVKVSGDLTMRGLLRNNYTYISSPNESTGSLAATNVSGDVKQSNQEWFMSTTEVQVDADLTDNVQTVIRLVNQRDWNVRTAENSNNTTALGYTGNGYYTAANTTGDEFNVDLELAYVTLKDFIYSPLTVTIGRQNLWFGRGFIIGANQQVPNTLSAPEYTAINGFDAVKAVLDFDPWTITGVYSKLETNAIQANDDVDLYGVNVGYKFNAYKAEAEGYWFYKKDDQVRTYNNQKYSNDIHTIGARGSADPIEWATINLEGAFQGGKYVGSTMQTDSRDRCAWAFDASAECRYFTDKVMWKPKFGAEYIWYSGNQPENNPTTANGSWYGWDPMYRGKFDSAIREFVGKFYQTGRYGSTSNYYGCPDASYMNQNQVVLMGSLNPMESLTLKANYNFFWTQEDYLDTKSGSGGFIGSEFDVQAMWDYTEDVSFGLLAGWFFPGTVYFDGADHAATDVVGTMKVSF